MIDSAESYDYVSDFGGVDISGRILPRSGGDIRGEDICFLHEAAMERAAARYGLYNPESEHTGQYLAMTQELKHSYVSGVLTEVENALENMYEDPVNQVVITELDTLPGQWSYEAIFGGKVKRDTLPSVVHNDFNGYDIEAEELQLIYEDLDGPKYCVNDGYPSIDNGITYNDHGQVSPLAGNVIYDYTASRFAGYDPELSYRRITGGHYRINVGPDVRRYALHDANVIIIIRGYRSDTRTGLVSERYWAFPIHSGIPGTYADVSISEIMSCVERVKGWMVMDEPDPSTFPETDLTVVQNRISIERTWIRVEMNDRTRTDI